jgi:hypothetical protein
VAATLWSDPNGIDIVVENKVESQTFNESIQPNYVIYSNPQGTTGWIRK